MVRVVLWMVAGLVLASVPGGGQEHSAADEQYEMWKQGILAHPGVDENPSDQQFAAVVRRLESGEARVDIGMVGLNNGFDVSIQPLRVEDAPGPEGKCTRVGEAKTLGMIGAGDNKRRVTEQRVRVPVDGNVNALDIRVKLATTPTESPEMRLVLPLAGEARFGLRRVTDVGTGCEVTRDLATGLIAGDIF